MTPDPVILIPGTYGYVGSKLDTNAWWWPGDRTSPPSPWVQAARNKGIEILSRPGLPFIWDTGLYGICNGRSLTGWKSWGDVVLMYALMHGRRHVQVVGFSHGGNVAAFAARRRLSDVAVTSMVTLGTPVRLDMANVYDAARKNLGWWEHVYAGPRDFWQIAGEIRSLRSVPSAVYAWILNDRMMPAAHHNRSIAESNHTELMDVATWNKHELWRLLLR